jgi:hypothetical protein
MAKRFVLGKNETQAPDQFEIDPKLQRTKAGDPSVRQGLTLGTTIFDYSTLQNKQVVLKNRAVPFNNSKNNRLNKVPPNVINTLQVPTQKSKGNYSQEEGS